MKKIFFLSAFLMAGLFSCQSQSAGNPAGLEETEPVIQEIDVAEFRTKMAEEGIVILDVRTPEEIAEGKIDGAMELNFYDGDFAAKVAELEKDKTYLVYCRSGKRSLKACTLMEGQGFTRLYSLAGGYNAWSQQ